MLQIAFIRESRESNPGFGKRNMDAKSIVEDVIKLDTERRATQVELDGILAESNKLSKDIGEMMKNGENRKPLS
jgi:seryl-tRNA synthetase